MFDVTSIGELLIDFTPIKIAGESGFLPKPGGAPANVAAAVSRLGGRSAFIGKVGKDRFGYFLKSVLDNEHVDTSGLVMDESSPTTLAFVHLDEFGDRSFSFYREFCADTMLSVDELNLSVMRQSKVLCFGSVSLTESPAKKAVMHSAGYAKSNGVLVGFDPNYRPFLWDSAEKAVSAIHEALPFADIIKVSDEEMTLITGETDFATGTKKLMEFGARLVVVTLGAKGAFVRYGDYTADVPGISVNVLDTNGAGDAFFGALLYRLTRSETPLQQTNEEIKNAVIFANVVGALTSTAHGAISAIPSIDTVMNKINGEEIISIYTVGYTAPNEL